MRKLILSWKFYLGASLIILSFIIGAITHFTIIIYFNDHLWRWVSVVAYIISWPMLIIGAWWAGKEFVESVKKYFSYQFYSRRVKKGTRKVYRTAKNKTKNFENKAKLKAALLRENTRKKTQRLKEKTSERTRKIKEKARRIIKK